MIHRRSTLNHILVAAFLATLILPCVSIPSVASQNVIQLEEFRWSSFPLSVLVDMNQWSTAEYAVAVREALNSWIDSIWNYTDSFGETALRSIGYVLYLSNINSTNNYDVFITFSADEIKPNVVGLTMSQWDQSHVPIPPTLINVTTFSKTAEPLFIKNVVMHEFGHALGLGHVSSQYTSDGPECMYESSVKNQIVYPSTLDVYGLVMLYQGAFGQVVQLPPSIPYKMLSDGNIVPSPEISWEDLLKYLIIVAALLLVLILGLAIWKVRRKPIPEKPTEEVPPNPPDNGAQDGMLS